MVKGKKKIDDEFTYGITKYTKDNPINFDTVLKAVTDSGSCKELNAEFKRIITLYGIDFGNMSFEDMMKIVVKEPKWLTWLLENDFISDTQTDVYIGDVFSIYKEPHMLIALSDINVCLVNLTTGTTTTVENVENSDDLQPKELFVIFDIDDEVDELRDIIESRIPKHKLKILAKGR